MLVVERSPLYTESNIFVDVQGLDGFHCQNLAVNRFHRSVEPAKAFCFDCLAGVGIAAKVDRHFVGNCFGECLTEFWKVDWNGFRFVHQESNFHEDFRSLVFLEVWKTTKVMGEKFSVGSFSFRTVFGRLDDFIRDVGFVVPTGDP